MYHEKYEESIIEFQMLEKYTGEGFYSATLADMLWVQTQRVTDPLPDVDSIRRTPRMLFLGIEPHTSWGKPQGGLSINY